MKTLSCQNMGNDSCSHVAKGETNEEAVDQMMEHAKVTHPEDLAQMSEEEMRAKMESNVKEN